MNYCFGVLSKKNIYHSFSYYLIFYERKFGESAVGRVYLTLKTIARSVNFSKD